MTQGLGGHTDCRTQLQRYLVNNNNLNDTQIYLTIFYKNRNGQVCDWNLNLNFKQLQ